MIRMIDIVIKAIILTAMTTDKEMIKDRLILDLNPSISEGITYAYALPYLKIALLVSDGVLAFAFILWGFLLLFRSSLKKEKEVK